MQCLISNCSSPFIFEPHYFLGKLLFILLINDFVFGNVSTKESKSELRNKNELSISTFQDMSKDSKLANC